MHTSCMKMNRNQKKSTLITCQICPKTCIETMSVSIRPRVLSQGVAMLWTTAGISLVRLGRNVAVPGRCPSLLSLMLAKSQDSLFPRGRCTLSSESKRRTSPSSVSHISSSSASCERWDMSLLRCSTIASPISSHSLCSLFGQQLESP